MVPEPAALVACNSAIYYSWEREGVGWMGSRGGITLWLTVWFGGISKASLGGSEAVLLATASLPFKMAWFPCQSWGFLMHTTLLRIVRDF